MVGFGVSIEEAGSEELSIEGLGEHIVERIEEHIGERRKWLEHRVERRGKLSKAAAQLERPLTAVARIALVVAHTALAVTPR